MGFKLKDGAGRGYEMSISESLRGNVSAKVARRPYYVSRDDNLAFVVSSVAASIAAGEYLIYIKNTSTTRNLFIGNIHLGAENNVLWKAWGVTGTASGTTITSVNLNLASSITPESTTIGDSSVTGLTAVDFFHKLRTLANDEKIMDFDGALILGPNNAIAVEYDTGTTGAADATIEYHFEDFERNN